MEPQTGVQNEPSGKSRTQSTAEVRRASWSTFSVFCCLFATMGFLNCVGCFRFIYKYKLLVNHSSFQLSWIFSVQRASLWAFGPLYGRLVDTYGPGVVIWPLAAICAFEVFAMSLVQEYWYLMLTQGVLFGLAAGGVYSACLISMGHLFDRHRGLLAGIAACGSGLGGIVYPIFIQWTMERATFQTAMLYTAVLTGIALAPSLFLVRGHLPINGPGRNAEWFDLALFRQKQYPYFVLGSFLVMWGYWAPIDYIMQSALDAGTPPLFALCLIPSMSAASIPGHVIFGHLGDRLGQFFVLTWCSLGLGLSLLVLWVPFNHFQSALGIFTFALFYGFLGGAFISLLMPCVAKLGSVETIGQRFGTFQLVMAISCLTGLPIMEAIRTIDQGYLGMQTFASASIILGSAFLLRSLGLSSGKITE